MNILSFPEIKEVYEDSSYQWGSQLKKFTDEKLRISVQELIDKRGQKENNLWDFAAKIIAELSIRGYAKRYPEELKSFKEAIKSNSNCCMIGVGYCVELAGIRESTIVRNGSQNKIIHLYDLNKKVKEIFIKWKKAEGNGSFEQYVEDLTCKEKRALKAAKVKYLTPEQHKEHRVTFDRSGKIKIGGSYPQNGKYIFALNRNEKELLAGVKKRGSFQHSSFFAGSIVDCAGVFTIASKKIDETSLLSGHYCPEAKHGAQLHKFLSDSSQLGPKKAKEFEIITYKRY